MFTLLSAMRSSRYSQGLWIKLPIWGQRQTLPLPLPMVPCYQQHIPIPTKLREAHWHPTPARMQDRKGALEGQEVRRFWGQFCELRPTLNMRVTGGMQQVRSSDGQKGLHLDPPPNGLARRINSLGGDKYKVISLRGFPCSARGHVSLISSYQILGPNVVLYMYGNVPPCIKCMDL